MFIWPHSGLILSNTLHNNFINCFYKCFRAYAHFPMFMKLLRSKLYFNISLSKLIIHCEKMDMS